jgi:hypothetical protein
MISDYSYQRLYHAMNIYSVPHRTIYYAQETNYYTKIANRSGSDKACQIIDSCTKQLRITLRERRQILSSSRKQLPNKGIKNQ